MLPCTFAAPCPGFSLALVSRKPKLRLSSVENQSCKRKLTAGNSCIKSKKQSSASKCRDQFTPSLAVRNYFYWPRSYLQLHEWRKAFWTWIVLCMDGRRSLSIKIFPCPHSPCQTLHQSGEMHMVGEEGDGTAGNRRWWYVKGVWALWYFPVGQIFHPGRTCLCVGKLVGKRISISNSPEQSKDRWTEIASGNQESDFRSVLQ